MARPRRPGPGIGGVELAPAVEQLGDLVLQVSHGRTLSQRRREAIRSGRGPWAARRLGGRGQAVGGQAVGAARAAGAHRRPARRRVERREAGPAATAVPGGP